MRNFLCMPLKNNAEQVISLTNSQPDRDIFRLLMEIKQDNSAAFQEIYYRWHEPICNFLKRILSAEDAEDIAQDIFIRLWEERANIDPEKNVRALIYLMARQAVSRFFKRMRVRADYLLNNEFNEINPHDSLDELIAKETRLLAEAVVEAMPEQRREIYKMWYQKHMSYPQIAQSLNIPVKTVTKQIHVARRHIQEIIALFLWAVLS